MRFLLACIFTVTGAMAGDSPAFDYRLLATNRTSTMQKEMNEAAAAGYAYSNFVGGETSFGGHEVVVVMVKPVSGPAAAPREYRLLSDSSPSKLQKEMQAAGQDGFEYKGSTVFRPVAALRGSLVGMERSPETASKKFSYELRATARTSSMQKELQDAGQAGFSLLGVTFGESTIGVSQVVAILGKTGQ